jgi:molecular chaperone DnaJ
MQLKDYYKTLGVKPSASLQEIKRAYRALAVKYHPDKNPDNSMSEAQFKEIGEAWHTLSDLQKRAKYDDERWLSGMGRKTRYDEAITPQWILNICIELHTSLASMDTYRMSQEALQSYILLILAESNIAILRQDADAATISNIISELIKASTRLESIYMDEVLSQLELLAADDPKDTETIAHYAIARKQQRRKDRAFPYIVVIITIALCIFMYFYGNK